MKEKDHSKELLNVLTRKEIYSVESNEPVVFVNDIHNESLSKDNVYSDGLNMIDYIADFEDDISMMYCILKNGGICNMEDFYSDNVAFDDFDTFFKNVKELIADRDNYEDL
jgi:hypothetical protein